MASTEISRHSRPRILPQPPRRGTGLWAKLGAAGLLALALVASAAQPATGKPRSVNELRGFFQQRCVRCHGADGSARGPAGEKLGGLDFTKAAQDFQALAGPGSEREIRKMVKTIQKGIFFGQVMPAWKAELSPEESETLVREILLKSERGKTIQPLPEPTNPS